MEFSIDINSKLDSLFSNWISDSTTSKILAAIEQQAVHLENGGIPNFDFSLFNETPKAQVHPQPKLPISTNLPSQKTPSSPNVSEQNTPSFPLEKSSASIPIFYGISKDDDSKKNVINLFNEKGFTIQTISTILKKYLRLPGCFSQILISSFNNDFELLKKFIIEELVGHDSNECFFKIIIGPISDRDFVFPQDFSPFVQSIVETHESLKFLKEEITFQEKFIDFIVTRCFYILDPDLRGSANLIQFRKVDVAGLFYKAEQMSDVNEAHHIFNYQHFYVAFCKFWDLDVDSDGLISKDELMKFNDSGISQIIIERFFHSSFYPRSSTKKSLIDFTSFVYFLISSEDKTNKTSINFWYKICDTDDDGILSIYEIEKLYENQYSQMQIQGHETIPFDDILKQLIDMIKPLNNSYFTIEDLEKSKMADVFFNTLFDLPKFMNREYQSPSNINDESTKGLTPWEIYVLIEYDALVNDAN